MRAAPGQRLRAKLIEGDGHPLVRLEVCGHETDLDALRLAARLARHEGWAQKTGHLDLLCALAGTRKGDTLIADWVRRGRSNHRVAVHRLRGGVLRFVATIEASTVTEAMRSLQLVYSFAPSMLRRARSALPLQRPITRRAGKVALELRLAPRSGVRLRCELPANQNGGAA